MGTSPFTDEASKGGRFVLTRLAFRNFKRFAEAEVELGGAVVLVGPNNSGKTTALQALTLWEIGVRRWLEKHGRRQGSDDRRRAAINRKDLFAMPVPDCNQLWRDLRTQGVPIEVTVEGVTEDRPWACGMTFEYANEESLSCRPIWRAEAVGPPDATVPEPAGRVRVAYLPPMSGLAAQEQRVEPGRVNVLVGEGRTAEVLRNLCFRLASGEMRDSDRRSWVEITGRMRELFGITLHEPEYIRERGEITLDYEEGNARLDLSAAGRGLLQTLLLLAYLQATPGAVLLVDEPDAHLEVLRQRQIYRTLVAAAEATGGQVIMASHSDTILREAIGSDIVISFAGPPHRVGNDSALQKALKEISYGDYLLAQERGWALYLEGSTDLRILRAFADTLGHKAAGLLEAPLVHYAQEAQQACSHFYGLRDAKPDLKGIAILDRDKNLPEEAKPGLALLTWGRREIENYLCYPEVLVEYAATGERGAPLAAEEAERRKGIMRECIRDNVAPAALRDRDHPWWADVKASDEFLDRVLGDFFGRLGTQVRLHKGQYDALARLVPAERISTEVCEKLDAIVRVAEGAVGGPLGPRRLSGGDSDAAATGEGDSQGTEREQERPAQRRLGCLAPTLVSVGLALAVALLGGISGCRDQPPARPTVAFVAPGGDLCLARFAAPGTVAGGGVSIETVGAGGGDIVGLAWSPDGATLGCVRIRDDETRVARLYRVEDGTAGAGEDLDLPADQPLCDLSWSPDGKYLAVDVGTAGGGRALLILDAQARQRVAVVHYAWGWCWAPATGAPRLAGGVPREVEPPLPFEDGRSCSVAVVDMATWTTDVLYPGTAQSLAFPRAWLADGRLLFMVLPADPALSPALWEVRPDEDAPAACPAGDVPVQYDDKALRALLPLELREAFTGRSSWAPGGDLVAIAVKTGAGTHVYVVDVARGQSRDIGPGTMPGWRPTTQ